MTLGQDYCTAASTRYLKTPLCRVGILLLSQQPRSSLVQGRGNIPKHAQFFLRGTGDRERDCSQWGTHLLTFPKPHPQQQLLWLMFSAYFLLHYTSAPLHLYFWYQFKNMTSMERQAFSICKQWKTRECLLLTEDSVALWRNWHEMRCMSCSWLQLKGRQGKLVICSL